MKITRRQLGKIIQEALFTEDKSGEGECPKSGCVVKRDGKWRVMSNKTGKLWNATYKSKKDAEAGLRAFHGGY